MAGMDDKAERERVSFGEAKRRFEKWCEHRGITDFRPSDKPAWSSLGNAFYKNRETDKAFICFYGGMHWPENYP